MFAAGKTSGGGGAPAATVDAQFNYVTMLLHGDGTNGAQNNTFLDSSANTFTITRNGNTTQGSFSPYGPNWSNNFNGTDALFTFPNSSNFAFGTGSFTIEFWINGPLNNDKFILGGRSAVTNMHITTGGSSSTVGVLRYVGSSGTIVSSNVVTDNTWHHCAIVRNGSSNITLYVDGVSVGTGTDTGNYAQASGTWVVGQNDLAASNYLDGYLSNLRIVTGTAVYTSNFTPSTTPLTAISGTSLLTCQSNRFIDNSATPVTITPTKPTVQRFNPFGTATAYSTAVIGGSGYFDGTGDGLTAPGSGAFSFGTGDFTIETWIYPNAVPASNAGIVDNRPSSGASANAFLIYISNGGSIYYFSNSTNILTGSYKINTWTHVAVTRSSGSLRLFINGTISGSPVSDSINLTDTSFIAGNTYDSFGFNGYMSDVRLVKGTAVYTSNFTPPTAPLTAITNTSILLNTTNGAIFDNAMMNDLETVGNAQISTSVYKYGTGSLAFDGTGDYLTSNAQTNLNAFGTGDFTVELWVYFNVVNTQQVVLDFRSSPGDTGGSLYLASNGSIRWYVQGSDRITGGTLSASTWTHIAVSRSGTSTKLFIDGTQSGSTFTDTFNYVCPSGRPYLGALSDGTGTFYYNGYMDDIRITKGYARYTANFTAPTAAFPNTGPV